jgi:PKD repeat protein
MNKAKISAILLALLMTATALAALPPTAATPADDGSVGPMDDPRPEVNITWLRADGVGTIGSTALYIQDGDLDIFMEAFPATGANWDPSTITDAELIIVEDHNHVTHYDADTVAEVQKNTGAIVVGNSPVATAMRNRGVPNNKIVDLSPSLGGTQSATNVAGCNITAIGMVHTLATSVQVTTFYVELPSGIKFFHGCDASGSSYASYIQNRALLDDLDFMALDFEHNMNTVWDEKNPNLLIETHTFSAAGEGYYYDDDPSSSARTRMDHNDTYTYRPPLPNVAPVLSLGSASPTDVTEDEEVTFKVFYTDVNDDSPTTKSVSIKEAQGTPTQHDLTEVASGTSWIDGKFLQYKTKLSPGNYTYRFTANDGEFDATGDIDWHLGTINVSPRNQVPQLSSADHSPSDGDTNQVFRFDVMYMDADNDEAVSAKVFIDGTANDMLTDTTSGPWNDWVTFYYETTLDVGVNHRYYFLFSDGEDQIRLPLASTSPNWFPGPEVTSPNYAPSLTADRFTPLSGTRDTEFTFFVTYTDGENNRPMTSYLYLDGTPYVMTPDGNDWSSGVTHTYSLRMEMGSHEYYFTFSDGTHDVRLPETGVLAGPDVINRVPTAVISAPADGVRYEPDDYVSFRSAGTDDPDGDQLDFSWLSDLDGLLGSTASIDVILSEGEHEITLFVEDPYEGSHQTKIVVLVKAKVPHIVILGIETDNDRPIEGDQVRVNVLLSNDGEAKATGRLVFIYIDGVEMMMDTVTVDIDGSRTVTYNWLALPGEHIISADVDMATLDITVQVTANTPPEATLEVINQGEKWKPGEELYFNSNVNDAEGDAVAYEWEFGDGGTSTKESPSHVFQDPGTYTVTLTITDTRGGSTVETMNVEIAKPKEAEDSPGPGAALVMAALASVLVVEVARRRRT